MGNPGDETGRERIQGGEDEHGMCKIGRCRRSGDRKNSEPIRSSHLEERADLEEVPEEPGKKRIAEGAGFERITEWVDFEGVFLKGPFPTPCS